MYNMKNLFNILSNNYPLMPLNESSLNRINMKHMKDGFVIISSKRPEQEPDEAVKKFKELIDFVKKTEFSYMPVYGGYHDKNEPEAIEEYEPAIAVFNHYKNGEIGNFSELKEFAIDMCGIFDQESVLVVSPNSKPVYIDREGTVIGKQVSDNTSFNDYTKEFFTALKKHPKSKRFSYDMTFEGLYINPSPCTLNEKMRRKMNGEIVFETMNRKTAMSLTEAINVLEKNDYIVETDIKFWEDHSNRLEICENGKFPFKKFVDSNNSNPIVESTLQRLLDRMDN
ncbi:MAG: hypothetical protein HUJ68_08005, partial [Clostridia bacterium]|nr:hypothetical protein [Clostridia bacterium]